MDMLMQPLNKHVLTPMLGATCGDSLAALALTDFPCMKLAASKGLSAGIVLGGLILKLPQIIKMMAAKSGDGVSFTSYAMESAAMAIGLAYNYRQGYPFGTYGETLFIVCQNIFVMLLIMKYAGKHAGVLVTAVAVLAGGYALVDPHLTSAAQLLTLQQASVVFGNLSKCPQILSNYRKKNTGQLSAATVAMQLLGSMARVFTTATEVKDTTILLNFAAASLLNMVVFYQCIAYPSGKRVLYPRGSSGSRKGHKEI